MKPRSVRHRPALRREPKVAAALTAAGAALTVASGGRAWAVVRAPDALTPVTASPTGHELAGAATALGWAGLAGVAALFAVRGAIRAALGVLLAVLGGAIAWLSATAPGHERVLSVAGRTSPMLRMDVHATVHPTAWWTVSAAGGLLLAAAGVLTAARGARWPGMSARYDPAGAGRTSPRSPSGAGVRRDDPSGLWKSIDRGEDPTESDDKEH